MNELQVFTNPEFGEIRGVLLNGEPWFVGKDMTTVLGYANASKALADHVDGEDKLNNETLLSLGQRGGWLINESGLYSLILSSKLPGAKRFKHWVTHEVLPAIRKTGSYSMNTSELSPELQIFKRQAVRLDNEVQIFSNPEYGKIRGALLNGEPWFVGRDVAMALGYSEPKRAIRNHVDIEDKIWGGRNNPPSVKDNMGRLQNPTWINESGLYSLILSSRLPGAKNFKLWVTHEVLPAIRKTGGYSIKTGGYSMNTSEPLPKLQMFKQLWDGMARVELQQKRQVQRLDKDKLMQMLFSLSPRALEYVWRPIMYAYYWWDGHDPQKLTLDDNKRLDLIDAVAHDSTENIKRLADTRCLLLMQQIFAAAEETAEEETEE